MMINDLARNLSGLWIPACCIPHVAKRNELAAVDDISFLLIEEIIHVGLRYGILIEVVLKCFFEPDSWLRSYSFDRLSYVAFV